VAVKALTVKEQLHRMVDALDEDFDIKEAVAHLAWLVSDEPELFTMEDIEAMAEAERAFDEGRFSSWDDVKRELDL
jgi:hypothetical protein